MTQQQGPRPIIPEQNANTGSNVVLIVALVGGGLGLLLGLMCIGSAFLFLGLRGSFQAVSQQAAMSSPPSLATTMSVAGTSTTQHGLQLSMTSPSIVNTNQPFDLQLDIANVSGTAIDVKVIEIDGVSKVNNIVGVTSTMTQAGKTLTLTIPPGNMPLDSGKMQTLNVNSPAGPQPQTMSIDVAVMFTKANSNRPLTTRLNHQIHVQP